MASITVTKACIMSVLNENGLALDPLTLISPKFMLGKGRWEHDNNHVAVLVDGPNET